MRILQVGVPFAIVGRSRKSWIRWNRNSFPGCDAPLRAHSGISQQTSPEYGIECLLKRTIDALMYAANNAVSGEFLLPEGSGAFSLKGENHDRSFSGQ